MLRDSRSFVCLANFTNARRSRRIPGVLQLSELPWMTSLVLAVVRAMRCQASQPHISILRAPTAECVGSHAQYLPSLPDVYPGSRRMMSDTFWPPKPNEFDIPVATRASLALLGTTSNGIAGSGTS